MGGPSPRPHAAVGCERLPCLKGKEVTQSSKVKQQDGVSLLRMGPSTGEAKPSH